MILETLRRIWYLLNRRRFDRELAGEMAFHQEMIAREGRAGFGSPLHLREQARDAWGWLWLDHSWRDFRHALRALRRSPGFTVAAVAVLSLGIGGATAMFSLMHAVLLKPLPFEDPGRLTLGRRTMNGVLNPNVSAPDYFDYREQVTSFDGFAAICVMSRKATVISADEPERAYFTYVSPDFFRVLGVTPAAGRWYSDEEARPGGPAALVVSAGLAQRRWGDVRRAPGQPLTVNGRRYTVAGVAPPGFRLLHEEADLWAPMRRGEDVARLGRQFLNWHVVARLKLGVGLATAQREMDVVNARLAREYPDTNTGRGLRLDPLQAALAGPYTRRLFVLTAAVGVVLLIACANVAGLLLARGSSRRGELAIRAALGASRARIAGQLLIESVTLALVSGALGVALAFWLHRLLPLVAGLGGSHRASAGLEWPVLLFALGVSALSGVLFGLAPAWRGSSRLLAHDLAPGGRSQASRAGGSLRGALVAAQVAMSLVLLVGAGLLIRSFGRLLASGVGFDAQRLLTGEIQLPDGAYPRERRVQFFDGLQEDLAAAPGVRAAGFVTSLPLRNPGFDLQAWNPDHPPASPLQRPYAMRRVVMPGYFEAVRIPRMAGRDFDRRDREGAPRVAIVNQELVRRLFPGVNPLGRRLAVDNFGPQPDHFEIVGVVGDASLNAVGEDRYPAMYFSYYQQPDSTMRFAVRTAGSPDALTNTIRRLVRARDASIPVENLIAMDQILGESLAPAGATATLLGVLAGLALLLAAIGLYGSLAYSVTQRTGEIGLRMALGARPADVLRLVLRQAALLAAAGVAAGLIASVALTRFLASMLFEVEPADPATFALVSTGLLAVALLAACVPAHRAARIDPVIALRRE
jgi:putative ABC transport system permease protein